MAYSILSIGDAEMMYNAFNGVAMVFASDNMNTLISIIKFFIKSPLNSGED